jgi:hypothetical protein
MIILIVNLFELLVYDSLSCCTMHLPWTCVEFPISETLNSIMHDKGARH